MCPGFGGGIPGQKGKKLDGFGSDLGKVSAIDATGIDPRIMESNITVMCDVTNPLCGPDGATMTFGAQKGADPNAMQELESGMCNYRDVIDDTFAIDCDEVLGAGAAGGLGAGLYVFLNAKMRSGIETVLDMIDFDSKLEGVDLVVTGEGSTDWQSCYGKVMQGVGKCSAAKGIPAVGLSGSMGEGAMNICKYGIRSIMTTVNAPLSLDTALARAEGLYYEGAVRMFGMIKTGMDMAER